MMTLTKYLLLQMYSDVHLCVVVVLGMYYLQIMFVHVCCESEELPDNPYEILQTVTAKV